MTLKQLFKKIDITNEMIRMAGGIGNKYLCIYIEIDDCAEYRIDTPQRDPYFTNWKQLKATLDYWWDKSIVTFIESAKLDECVGGKKSVYLIRNPYSLIIRITVCINW